MNQTLALDLGNFQGCVNPLSCSCHAVPRQLLRCDSKHCPAGRNADSGSAVAMRGFTLSKTMFFSLQHCTAVADGFIYSK